MSVSRLKNFFLEKTEGDGNCAFNAFILGLSRQSVIDNLEKGFIHSGENPEVSMRDFIQQTASALNIPSAWTTVKKGLAQLRDTSAVRLQIRMAPILRNLAIHLAENDLIHSKRTIEPLLSAFDDFVEWQERKKMPKEEQKERQVVEDDIFKHHQFIQHKFIEFFHRYQNKDEAVCALKQWWLSSDVPDSGYHQFLNAMRQERVWAGDLELFQLARYFRVNLDVFRDDYVHRIYSHSTKIPISHFTDDQIIQLIQRQIINPPELGDTELIFLPLMQEEIESRLKAVPQFKKVAWYIQEAEHIKGFAIPNDWSASLNQLWRRNLIEKKNDRYVCIAEREDAIKYSAAMPEYQKIMNLWQHFQCAVPTVTLSNPEAVHWSNVLPAHEKQATTAYGIMDYYQSFMTYIGDQFFSASTPAPAQALPPKKKTLPFKQLFFGETTTGILAAKDEIRATRHIEL